MQRRAKLETGINSRLISTEELREYTNLGHNSAVKLGDQIGARVQIGGRVLWDLRKLDEYFNKLTGVK